MAILVLVSQPVKNYAAWKAGFDANRPMRERAGLAEHFVGRDAKRSNLVHVGLMAPSMEAADDFLSNPKLLDAMAMAGVADVPEIRFVVLD
jgi:hypothetical protein